MADLVTKYAEDGTWGELIETGFGTAISGWEYCFNGEPGWNPDLVSEEEIADFQENVIDMIANGDTRSRVTEDANPGTY